TSLVRARAERQHATRGDPGQRESDRPPISRSIALSTATERQRATRATLAVPPRRNPEGGARSALDRCGHKDQPLLPSVQSDHAPARHTRASGGQEERTPSPPGVVGPAGGGVPPPGAVAAGGTVWPPLGVVSVAPGVVVVSVGLVGVVSVAPGVVSVAPGVVVVTVSVVVVSVCCFSLCRATRALPWKSVVARPPLVIERPATNSGTVSTSAPSTKANSPVTIATFQCLRRIP